MTPPAQGMRRNDRRARHHAGWWAFLVHRVSGIALALFLPVHFWALGQSLRGAAALDEFLRWTDQPLFKVAEWGLVVLLTAHLLGGLRVLWIEFAPWQGPRKQLIAWSAAASMVMGLLFAWALLGSHG